jgi:hypothetical protein
MQHLDPHNYPCRIGQPSPEDKRFGPSLLQNEPPSLLIHRVVVATFDAVANATIRPLISRFRANLEEPASSLVRRYIGTRSPCMFKYRIADRQMARCRSLIRKCIQQLGNYSQSHLSS